MDTTYDASDAVESTLPMDEHPHPHPHTHTTHLPAAESEESASATISALRATLCGRDRLIEELVTLTDVLLTDRDRQESLTLKNMTEAALMQRMSKRTARAEETVRMVEESLVLWEQSRTLEKHDLQRREQSFLLKIHELEQQARMSSTIAVELAEAEDRAEELQRLLTSERVKRQRVDEKYATALEQLASAGCTQPPDSTTEASSTGGSAGLDAEADGEAEPEHRIGGRGGSDSTSTNSPPPQPLTSPEHYNRVNSTAKYKPAQDPRFPW